MKHELTVDDASAGKRLDLFVGEKLSLSRAKLKALFDADVVRVDGRRSKKGHSVAAGQVVSVELSDAPAGAVADGSLPLTILREDDALVFVDKPSGVPVHPLAPGETGTIANALLARYPEMAGVGGDAREAGLCHRLDVETSGVLLAARTKAAWEAMRRAFGPEEAVEKRYLALVSGALADEGEIDLPLAHAGDHVRPRVHGEGARPARSSFRVLKRKGALALVEVQIHTGVLHQVRAHLAAVGAPIVGDEAYGGPPAKELGRFFLHAASLTVTHPVTHEALTVESPLPAALADFLTRHGLGAVDRALLTRRSAPTSPRAAGRGTPR